MKTHTFIIKICKISLLYDSKLPLSVKHHYNNDIKTAFKLLGASGLEEKSNS